MKQKILYTGTFDPITNGHTDLILSASKLFPVVVVAVARNKKKSPLFTIEERVDMVNEATKHIPNVLVIDFDEMATNLAKRIDASAILRGLRSSIDFEYEKNMFHINKEYDPDHQTVYLMGDMKNSIISSSMVRELGSLNQEVSRYVCPHVEEKIKEKFK